MTSMFNPNISGNNIKETFLYKILWILNYKTFTYPPPPSTKIASNCNYTVLYILHLTTCIHESNFTITVIYSWYNSIYNMQVTFHDCMNVEVIAWMCARSKESKEAHINTYYNAQNNTLNRVKRVERRLCWCTLKCTVQYTQ